MIEKNRIFSVRELNFAAKQLIESGLPLLWVRGEISNFVCAASGHWYFSLKDEQAQVRCVMFRHKSQYLDWQPKSGAQVEVLALPSLYEARGEFQLTLEQMRPAGMGALYEAFEKLKKKLEVEGLFADSRKRALPMFPTQIGIVTSPQAAALRDVLTTLSIRMPGLPVVLYPTPVQGAGAAQKIAEAIALANQRKECDVIVLCRGGGSIEDLWSFNEEVVARAIAASHIPIVCGVGHETDFTIADFVADQRAATPTAAAQAAVPERLELLGRVAQFEQRMTRAMLRSLERAMQQLDYLQRRLVHPAQRVQQQMQHLSQLQQRLQSTLAHTLQHQNLRWQAMQQRLRSARPQFTQHATRHEELSRRMKDALQRMLERYDNRLAAVRQHLQHLDPQRVLARGYSMVRDEHGAVVTDSAALPLGASLKVAFAKGWAKVAVTEKGSDK
ncbi:MAG: exodeoxyribonuclease VII large subunit [Gallionellaceae bacterium]|jgi:exodeoxyribonuclease VII large subunit